MMMKSKSQLSELLSAMNFPRAGETHKGVKVLSATATMEDDILKYEVVFPKGTKTKSIPNLLAQFFATQVIPTNDNLIVRHHDYTVKPKGGNVAVIGAMHVLSVVRANPGAQEFDEDYSKMEMTNPETYFRKHDCAPINSPQFRAKMFTFVSLMGENYGYGTDKCIYHRRASLIMPKIKITKAVPQAKMMYHTHPRKDEPSLSSPDDYLLYMDLSHKPRSIRHFYTVMADRMDYFHITPKKGSKDNYLKLDEDGIIEELDAEMNDIEAKWDKKTPKTGDYQDDLRFCENITRDVVKWLNKKYGKYFVIKYKCYYKVKKNPPVPEIDDLHLKDEVIEVGLESIKQRTQGLAPPKQKSHEDYVYWHHLRSLDTLQGSAKTLGISPQGSHKRTYSRYMNKAFEDTQYNYHDALNILNLAHDIARADSKIRDAGELVSRMAEICEYLEISETGTETLQFLEDVIHNENLFTEEAMTICGDFYGLALLSSYAIQAVGAIGEVKKGNREYEMIEYEIYTNLKSETQTRFQDFLIGEKDHRGYAFGENAPVAQGFVDSFLNPPPVSLKKVELEHVFPPEAFAYDFDLVKEALDEFNRNKYDPTKEFITLGRIHLRFPVTSGKVSMSITLRTGTAQIWVTGRPNAMEDALDAVTKVGTALVRYGLPIDPEEYDVQAIDAAQNPQTSQVIAIAGPSGAGKSTTIRSLLKLLPNSKTAPTVTTRKKRKSDKPGERSFVSINEFKKQMKKGNMVAAQLQKNGNYYGRRKSDFEGADYVIVDVNLKGINSIKRAYPNAFTVYLEPVEDPEFIRKRLLRRGDMSPQEARGRASIIPSHIKDSKNMDFDARIQTKQGEFAKIALELEPMIPKQNPPLRDLVSKIFSRRRPSITWNREQKGVGIPLTPNDEREQGDVIEEWPVAQLEELFKKDEGYYIPPQSEPSGKVLRIAELAEQGVPLPVPAGGTDGRGPFSFTDGRHRFVYTRDFTNDKTIPIAMSIRKNPSKKPKAIRIEESPNKEKKLVAYFYDKDGKKFRTVHFGARGMSDFTQHKNPDRMKNYLARHGGMGENWKDPMTAGALSRWILWGKPSLRESFNDFKKRFKLEGVMAVTNTRMNPSMEPLLDSYLGIENENEDDEEDVDTASSCCEQIRNELISIFPAQFDSYDSMSCDELREFCEMVIEDGVPIEGEDGALVTIYRDLLESWDECEAPFGVTSLENPSENLTPTPSEIKEALDIFGKQQGLDASNAMLIAGAALYMHGLKPVMNDVDAIIPGKSDISEGYVNGLELDIGGGPDFTPEMLEYEVKDGVRYQSLPAILAFYRMLNREKDQVWISKLSSMMSNPHHCPIEAEARRAASDPSFKHHEWYIEHHLDYVMAIAHALKPRAQPDEKEIINDIVWMHDYPKMMSDNDNFELVRELLSKHKGKDYADELVGYIEDMEMIKSVDSMYGVETTIFALIMSTADALAHYYGPFWQIYMDENKDKDLDFLKKSNAAKLEKDKRKLRAGPMEDGLDSVKFQYKGRKVRVVGNEHIAKLIERKNPRIPKKYEGQDPSEHSDLYTDEDPKGTIQGLGFKDKATAERSVNIIKRSGKTHAHKIQAAMAMEQRARFHPNATPGIKAAQKVYAKFIEEMKKKTKRNPPKVLYHGTSSKMAEIYLQEGKSEHQDQGNRPEHYGALHPEQAYNYALGQTAMDMNSTGNWDGDTHKEIYHPVVLQFDVDGLNVIEDSQERNLTYDWNSGREFVIMENISPDRISVHKSYSPLPKHGWGDYEQAKISQDELAKLVRGNPKKTPEGRKIPKRYLKGLNKEEMLIAAKEIDKGYKYDVSDPKAYEYWKSDIQATARGYKTVPSKYKKKFIKMYGPLPEKGKFLDKMAKATKIKKSILQKVYDKGLAAWRGGHRPGVQQHQWAAGRVYSFVTLGNTVKKGGKKMPDHSLAVKAGLIKDNPPSFISARDPQKWSNRYDKIIKMSGDELMELAEKQAAEKGLTMKLVIHDRTYQKKNNQLKLPPKQQKMYKEYIESMQRATITLSRGNKLIDRLRFTILTQSPKKLVEYLTNRKIWRKDSKNKRLEGLGMVRLFRGKTQFAVNELAFTAALQSKSRFPFAIAGSGGYQMSEGQKGKGYYGIIKTYQAGFLEANNMEQFGMGESPMRSDLYQSYGWLTAFSYKENYPYASRAAEYYLNLHGTTKKPNKDADYWNIYRPVYSRKMTGSAYRAGVKKMLETISNPSEADFFPGNKNVAPYYMTAQTIPITALQNGGEWRHGEFAEEDPFEEYF